MDCHLICMVAVNSMISASYLARSYDRRGAGLSTAIQGVDAVSLRP
jgi:hypothetical protein